MIVSVFQVFDLMFFLIIIAVFMVAYGVVRQAILYPNSEFNGLLIYSVFRASYWQMQGEIETFLAETERGWCQNMAVFQRFSDSFFHILES